ncbi:MAG: CRISPR-associated endonuclease Cas2 [Caldisericaceae bacterium]
MLFLTSYDISDSQRRLKVMKIMKNYGTRVQYSVFECILSNEKLEQMKREISKVISKDVDSVRIYAVPENMLKQIAIIGVGKVVRDEDFYII